MGLNLFLSHISQWISHIIVKLEYGKCYHVILPLQPLQHWYQLLIHASQEQTLGGKKGQVL